MDTNILKRLTLGFGANVLGQIVSIGIQLIAVPVLLYCWDTHMYGEWLILFAIPAYLAMSNLGFSMSAANDMTQLVARGDRKRALSVFQSLFALISFIDAILLTVIILCVAFLPIGRWWHSPDISVFHTRIIILFLCMEFLLNIFDGVNHAGYRSNGDYPLHTTLRITVYAIQNALLCLAALIGLGPQGAAITYCVVRAIGTLLSSIYLRYRHPWLHFGYKHSKIGELKRLFSPALANVGQTLSSALNVQGIVFVVGAILGPVAVVTLSTLRTLSRFVLQIVATIFNSTEPELARAYGKNDLVLASNIYSHIIRICLWFALLVCVALLLTGTFILRLWTHNKVTMDLPFFTLLLGASLAGAYWQACLSLIRAANKHLRLIAIYCACSAASIVVSLVLLKYSHQLVYVGVPTFLTECIAVVVAQYIASRMLKKKVQNLTLEIANPFPLYFQIKRICLNRFK